MLKKGVYLPKTNNSILKNIYTTPVLGCLLIFLLFPFNINGKTTIPFISEEYLNTLSEQDKRLIDSCLSVFNSTRQDTTKINTIVFLEDNINDDSLAMVYNQWLLDKLHAIIDSVSKLPDYDSLLLRQYKKHLANQYYNKAYFLSEKGEYKKSIEYLNRSLVISEQINDSIQEVSYIYNSLGDNYFYLGKLKISEQFFLQSLKIRQKTKDLQGQSTVLNNLATIYQELGDNIKALEYFFQALKIMESLHDSIGMAVVLTNAALLYQELGDYLHAEENLKKAIDLFNQENYPVGEASCYNNLGLIYTDYTKKPDKAIDLFYKALEILKPTGNHLLLARVYSNLGRAYFEKKDYKNAEKYLRLAQKILAPYQELSVDISSGWITLAQLELMKGNVETAKKMLRKAYIIAEKNGNTPILIHSAMSLSKILAQEHQYEQAYQYLQTACQTKDSVINEKTYKKLLQEQYKYRFEKQKIEQQKEYEKQMLLKEEENKRHQAITKLTVGALIIITILFAFLINRFVVTKRQSRLLDIEKRIAQKATREAEIRKHEAETALKHLNQSISYSKYIQRAILPSREKILSVVNEYFIFFKPKDVVGGDFYWFRKYNNFRMIACVDCTGHGIPGAFMTMISRGLLREAATIKGLRHPKEILCQMDEAINKMLKQNEKEGVQDGLDISIAVIDEENQKVTFAAAQRPVIIKLKNETSVRLVKGSKYSIGGGNFEEKEFEEHSFNLTEVQAFYLFTDGYIDQFGGPKDKRFKLKPFVALIQSIVELPIDEQYQIIAETFSKWKGNNEQVDDVCVIGVKC